MNRHRGLLLDNPYTRLFISMVYLDSTTYDRRLMSMNDIGNETIERKSKTNPAR